MLDHVRRDHVNDQPLPRSAVTFADHLSAFLDAEEAVHDRHSPAFPNLMFVDWLDETTTCQHFDQEGLFTALDVDVPGRHAADAELRAGLGAALEGGRDDVASCPAMRSADVTLDRRQRDR